MKIKAAVITEAGQPFEIEEVELAKPKFGEILVKVVACGVCHTDKLMQDYPFSVPVILGHEGSGIVEEIGLGVNEFSVGDRVCFSNAWCGHCQNCLSAHQHACENFFPLNFIGTMRDGTKRLSKDDVEISNFFGQSSFATYVVVHESSAIKITDNTIDISLVGPLGCGIQTGAGTVLNRLMPRFGSTIAIFGMGAVGMSSVMAAKISGCSKIIAIGGNPNSLELAKELGATHTINRKVTENVVDEIKNITSSGTTYAIDTSGVSEISLMAIKCTRMLGTTVLLGATGDLTLNVQMDLIGGAKTVIGGVEGDSNPRLFIPRLIEYYQMGLFPFDRIIKFYDFKDINTAFEDSHNGKTIKAVLKMV